MASLFRTLHGTEKFAGSLDVFDSVHRFVAITKDNGGWLPDKLHEELSALEKIRSLTGFTTEHSCHLDLMMENIVRLENGRPKLLDWEYSACSDPRYDLAMLSVKGEFGEHEDRLLVSEYRKKDDDEFLEQIRLMKAAVFFREAAWALVQMTVSKISFDYKKYATDHLQGFDAVAKLAT